jgi:hypothetical protein
MREANLRIFAKLNAVAAALETAVVAGAEFYANGGGAARPGVAKHFTAGNAARYGWAPLSVEYAKSKASQTMMLSPGKGLVLHKEARDYFKAFKRDEKHEISELDNLDPTIFGASTKKSRVREIKAKHEARRRSIYNYYGKGRVAAKLEKGQLARGQGDSLVMGSMARYAGPSMLPILVRTGKLRDAVTTLKHRITREGDTALIYFDGLPEYAIYHQTGTKRMPRRSPVDPNELDGVEIRAAMQRHLDAAMGTGQRGLPISGTTIPGAARMA